MLQKLKNMGYLFWLTVGAAIFLGGLTIFQAYDKVQSDQDAIKERKTAEQERIRADLARQEAKTSQENADKYFDDLKEANSIIQNLNKQSLTKSDEIIQKSEEVIKTQAETIRSITGFGTPLAIAGRTKDNNGVFYILNTGNYNIKNLSVNVYDFSNGLKDSLNLEENTISSQLLETHIVATTFNVTLPPSRTLTMSGFFQFAKFKAFEIRMSADHGEFREFYISEFDSKSGLITKLYYKLYEIDRLTFKWKLLDQKPKDSSKDELFEKYFILTNYLTSSM